jgi:hypothetical protein
LLHIQIWFRKKIEIPSGNCKKINISIPYDEKGIPSAQAQKVWLFPYKYLRINNEISRLWSFFHKAINDTLSDTDFDDVLKIKSTGKTKLTEALFYINPDKFLPINGPTKPYLKEKLHVDPKFNSFSDYMQLLKKIRESTDLPFYELSYEAWEWNNNRNNENYWIFQGNPKFYDIVSSLREGALKTWSVAAHKDKIKNGDKVILWVTGDKAGCYALCKVNSEITNRKDDPSENKFYIGKSENVTLDRVEIEIESNLYDRPVLKESLKDFPEFAEFKGGNQGTNFNATKEQYEKILEMINNSEVWVTEEEFKLIELITKVNKKEAITFHFERIDELVEHFQLKDSDIRIVFSTPSGKKFLPVTISHRYVLASFNERFNLIIPFKEKRKIARLANIIETSSYDKFGNETEPPIWAQFLLNENFDTLLKEFWFESVSDELNRFENSNFNRFDNSAYRKAAFDKEYREKIIDLAFSEKKIKFKNEGKEPLPINPKPITIPQNLILYGPPGTGKTYQLIKNYIKYFTDKSDGKSKEVFTYELVSELKWWEVITLSLFELGKAKVNELTQHPLLAEKINQSENSKPRNTVWFWLQNHTKEDCKNVNVAKRSDPQIFWKDENSVWSIDKKLTEEMLPDLVEKLDKWKNFKPENKVTKRYEMITFHQSYSYEEFIEGIRPGFDEEEELRYKIEPGIFLRIAEKARKDYQNNYAIFIDEINRGNISKIFGELITLIESDKRQGGENELEVILPYSKSKFSVPSNLYIIGTMNTADRSIALIDTALRRRFCFKEMMPDSSLLNDDVEGINLQLLLSKINERIDFLLDRDHTIGHSFFMKASSKNEICAIFKNKIIPLLQEYFYNDWEKVQLVLGDNKSWGKTEEQKLVRVKKHYDLSAEKELFGSDIEDFEDEIIYEINPALEGESFDEISTESFIHIYQKPGKAIF